ncbi:hypothetical protein [Antribacter gilvus]|uniref:hypothetical protein n=1 Tax=Antribacter gilvus TaxID=2304675 RepID=UPI000F786BA5|nr:hypothetical protein [Antribacter gilvus]
MTRGETARALLASLVAFSVGLLAVTDLRAAPTAHAWWSDSVTDTATVSAWTIQAPATTCTDTDGQLFETAAVTWSEVTSPAVLDYRATFNGRPAPVTDNGSTRSVVIDQGLITQVLGSLLGGTYTIVVTPFLPGTSWTGPTSTRRVQGGVSVFPPGLTLECVS